MAAPFLIPVTPAAMLAAVACVVAGGPWFADGLHALRARRALRALRGQPFGPLRPGVLVVRGRVALESPLFAPLSARPCAGYVLEARLEGGPLAGAVHAQRDFRLETPDGPAEIAGARARWEIAAHFERTFATPDELSENLTALLERSPELRWLKSARRPIVLTERALLAGAEVCVLGVAEALRAEALPERVELARTGTDDDAVVMDEAPGRAVPAWRVGPEEPLERCVVSDRAPRPDALAPPAWRVLGALGGPALLLAGLLALVHAAAPLLEGGR
jgi:hypothetical protein